MSDRVFSGRDVAEALAQAAQALGVGTEGLRYVVLDAGTPGGLGLKPTLARVAVLLGVRGGGVAAPAPATPPDPGPGAEFRDRENAPAAEDPASGVQRLVAALAGAAAADLRVEVSETADVMEVMLRGSDTAFLLGPSGPEVLEALDHLLHGMFAHRVAPRRLRVECEGQRQHREQRLKAEALALAAEVLRDGQPRTTEPLNSYERRLVHTAVADLSGLVTYSVGGGSDRRVTIAPEKASLGGEVH